MNASRSVRLIALLHGPDRPGLVAEVAGWIAARGGNIIHADQHRDGETNVFFQRMEWAPRQPDELGEQREAFATFARETLGMTVRVVRSDKPVKVALFVSRFDHCFHDLLLRFKAGELNGTVACVLSNHPDLGPATAGYAIPFYHLPINADTKAETEARQLEILQQHGVELAVLARYMQILSPEFLRQFGNPVINIHHSFLPAFAGGRPYHQAYSRGVKLIGATAHYATPVLDDGPIIAQDVTRISHRHGVADLIQRGRDLEKIVLAQAVRWHLQNRILVYANKTVVFD